MALQRLLKAINVQVVEVHHSDMCVLAKLPESVCICLANQLPCVLSDQRALLVGPGHEKAVASS